MALKDAKLPQALVATNVNTLSSHRACFKDTDPEMLFALWEMEMGVDPDKSLETVEGATVVYDKFRARLSHRLR